MTRRLGAHEGVPPSMRAAERSLECGEGGTEVDVKDLALEGECWNGLDAQLFRFRDASAVRPQVHNFDIESVPVNCCEYRLLGADAHWASGVVEHGLLLHHLLPWSRVVRCGLAPRMQKHVPAARSRQDSTFW